MKKKQYKAKRHRRRVLHKYLTAHSTWWALVCFGLLVIMTSFIVQTEALKDKNEALTKQLASETSGDNSCRTVGSWTADELRQISLASGGLQRSYLIHLPTGFRNTQYYPLVVVYSGKGATASTTEKAFGLDTLPAIVVYPAPTVGTTNLTAWEGAPYSSDADDVAFTTDILNDVQSKLCINRSRVYAAGFSNGGGFAALLSCRLSDRFAAYAIVAGALYPPENNCKAPVPTPLISVHGDNDSTVPYRGSLTRQLPAIESWVSTRAAHNGCSRHPDTIYQADSIVVTTWDNCKNNATVQNIRIEGGGHRWGGISDQTLWNFLSQFSL